jgi:predicted secreted protein
MTSARTLAIVFCALLIGCAQSAEPDQVVVPQLDASVHGQSVSYPPAQAFELTLDSYSDAGYRWDCSISDSGVVALQGKPTYRQKTPGPIVPGGLSVAVFHFRANYPGTCVVTLVEHQRWMVDVPPRATVQFSVVVHL